MQWAWWDYKWVDPLGECNSEAEYDNDMWKDDAAYGPDVDDLSHDAMW